MNIFLSLIKNKTIQDQESLKKHFRILALKMHPDTSLENSDKKFIKLKHDYDEALILINENFHLIETKQKIVFTKQEMYTMFNDLISSGFPINTRKIKKTQIYTTRVLQFSKCLEYFTDLQKYTFLDVEKELYTIRGDSIIDNPLFTKVQLILFTIVSWNNENRIFTKKSLNKWFQEIENNLQQNNCPALYSFLQWILHDINTIK